MNKKLDTGLQFKNDSIIVLYRTILYKTKLCVWYTDTTWLAHPSALQCSSVTFFWL